MNLVYVCREFGPVTGGGIGTYIYNVCMAMAGRGHNVYLVTDCFHEDNMGQLPSGVHLVPTISTPAHRRDNFISVHHEYSYRILDTLRELICRIDPDIIEFAEFGVEGFATIRAKRLLNEFPNVKLIIKLHTPSSLLYHINEDRKLYSDILCDCSMEDYCVRYADMVTSPSLSLADYFKERVGRQDICQCPYPMDLPVREGQRKFSQEQVHRVRFIGSVQVRKGLDTFIEAAKLVLAVEPDFSFEIWGADRNAPMFGRSYVDILKRDIPEELTEKISFAGGVPYSEIPALFDESCFCVYPSRWENWANVCLEAMSFGCVVIASQNGGMGEMIEHGRSGFVVDPLNPKELADIILDNFPKMDNLQTISGAARIRSREICEPDATSSRIEQNYEVSWDKRTWKNCTDAPLVSVVIPYFNQPQYVQETVLSVKASTYSNIEIVVVNDGSTTEEANEVFKALEGITKVQKKNGGLSSARNAGIFAAGGDFILPLDSDDTIHPEYIKRAVEALLNNEDLAYVSCHAQNFGELKGSYIPLGYVPELMLFINTDGKCSNLYRRLVFDQTDGYDEVMTSYEDWDFLITLHENGFQGDVLPDELFNYRRHFDSMVYQTANRQRSDLIQYMMMKHQKALQESSSQMAIVLSRLWKETEVQYEFALQQIANLALSPATLVDCEPAGKTRLQVYSLIGEGYWEHNSVFIDYPEQSWKTFVINLPFAGQTGEYRFDPTNRPGVVLIRELAVLSCRTGKKLWLADASNGFEGCTIVGVDSNFIKDDCLVLLCKTNDPQIVLPSIGETDSAVTLTVTLHYTAEVESDVSTLSYQVPEKNYLKKYLSKITKIFN